MFNQLTTKNKKTDERINSSSFLSLRSKQSKFNIAVLMNTIHELSIQNISEAIEDIRRHLTDDGYLLLLDLPILLEGEQTFVPFDPLDVSLLFGEHKDFSYKTRTGIYVLFTVIPNWGIPIFHNLSYRLRDWFRIKRDLWSQIANYISKGEREKACKMMHLGENVLFNFGYANIVATNINIRISEFENSKTSVDMATISKCTLELVELFNEFYYRKNETLPTLRNVYDSLNDTYSYKVIEYIINTFRQYTIVFRVYDPDTPLQPTEVWNIVDDEIGWDKVKDIGLDQTLYKAHRIHEDKFGPYFD